MRSVEGVGLSGRVVQRIHLDEHISSEKASRRVISEDFLTLLGIVRELLITFAMDNGYIIPDRKLDESAQIASVVYMDGERETISINQFDVLIRNDAWRKQILFIQGHIPIVSRQQGFFGVKKKVS